VKNLAFDIETDGLIHAKAAKGTEPAIKEATTLHSLVLRDMDSKTIISCADQDGFTPLDDGLAILAEAERIYGHNIVYYDIPILWKLRKWKPKGTVRDTLLIAQMRFAHQKDLDWPLFRRGHLPGALIGLHTIEAWGYRLGIKKHGVDIEDWSVWTPLMQQRCESDTLIVKRLVRHINEAGGVTRRSVEIEHELAEYLRQQEANGWPFDVEKAKQLEQALVTERAQAEHDLVEEFGTWEKKGKIFTPKRDNKALGYKAGVPVQKMVTVTFNPGSRMQIADRLKTLYGWVPVDFTDKGQPEVSEETLSGLSYPPVKKILRYLMLDKRLGALSEGKEAWLKHATKDMPYGGKLTGMFHIHHRVKQNGTITHRAAHASPNLGQVTKVGSPFGKECRELFLVPGDSADAEWVELGVDVSGLELRCLAHYMARYDDGAYGQIVLAPKGSPNEIHLFNSNILGISRDDGKTFIYAYLYGAGDGKLGLIIAPGKSAEEQEKIGKRARRHFQKAIPALGLLDESVKRNAERGFLKLIDGRRVYIRAEHAALNSLLQGTGAIICKRWIVEAQRKLVSTFGPQGWNGKWAAMGWIHDETQTAVRTAIKEQAASIWIDSIRMLQDYFAFRLPLDGEAKYGRNWAECH
jgi:DNA polymerase I